MDAIKVYYDEAGHTLTVWFGDSSQESFAEEVGDDIVVMRGNDGSVLGFEKLNVHYSRPENLRVEYQHST